MISVLITNSQLIKEDRNEYKNGIWNWKMNRLTFHLSHVKVLIVNTLTVKLQRHRRKI